MKAHLLNPSDAELIEAYRRGHRAAADALVTRHLSRIRNFLFRLVLDSEHADELTQEVFVRVLKNLDGFRGQSLFTTWLYQIAINTARHSQRRNRVRFAQSSDDLSPIDAMATPPDSNVLQQERTQQVQQALSTIPPTLRSALVLTVLQGLSAAEAATIEGCAVGTIYWRVHEARRLLRDELKDLCDD